MPDTSIRGVVSLPDVLRLIVEESGQLRRLQFPGKEPVTIGRTADNAVRITDALSSRHHCEIAPSSDGFLVRDLRSRNGTRLNGEPLTEQRLLEAGDRIQVGDSIVHFSQRLEEPTVASARPRRRPRGQPLRVEDEVHLMVTAGEDKGQRAQVSSLPFTIGRKTSCGLTLIDAEVSNEHCMIVEDEGVLHLVDLGSTNGTFVEGERLRGRTVLRQRAVLRLGMTLGLKVVPAGEETASSGRPRRSARQARRSARQAPPPQTEEQVEEIHDLDALGEEEETIIASEGPASENQRLASEVVAQEGDVLDAELDLGARLSAAASGRPAGRGLGAAALLAACLVVAGALILLAQNLLQRPLQDPPGEHNLVENWSFEEAAPSSPLPAWELRGDGFKLLNGGDRVRQGQRALSVSVAPGTRPEVASDPVRVSEGSRYRVRASYLTQLTASLALRVDWGSDTDPSFSRSSVAAVTDSQAGSDWRELGGTVAAPRGATQARVVAVALSSGGAGELVLDRIRLIEDELSQVFELPGPAGLMAELEPSGVLSLSRASRQLATEVGLALQPLDPLSYQAAGRLDQPLGLQADGSLLALSALRDHEEGEQIGVAFVVRSESDGLQLRWTLPTPEEGPLVAVTLRMLLPRLAAVTPLALDGQALPPDLPAELPQAQPLTELSWGTGAEQVSFRFLNSATLTIERHGKRGAVLWVELQPQPIATGELGVGVDLVAASLSTHAAIGRLFLEAKLARQEGRYSSALQLYRTVLRRFSHEQAEVARAEQAIAQIEQQAQRQLDFLAWLAETAEDLPAPQLARAASPALAELERGYQDARRLRPAREAVTRVEQALARSDRRLKEERIQAFLRRGARLREAGHVRLARLVYRHVVDQFDPKLAGVDEAQSRLEALPVPKGGQ